MPKELKALREEIDVVDKEVIELLSKRMEISIEIKKIKRQIGITTIDSTREEALKKRIAYLADKNGLDQVFCLKLYKQILTESRRVQNRLYKK